MTTDDERIPEELGVDEDVFAGIPTSVVADRIFDALDAKSREAKETFDEVLAYHGVRDHQIAPPEMTTMRDRMDWVLRSLGFMRRPILLEGAWWEDAIGAMLATLKDTGDVIALIPRASGGYAYRDWSTGRTVRISKATASRINPDAVIFYRPFPQRKLTLWDLVTYGVSTLKAPKSCRRAWPFSSAPLSASSFRA